MQLLERYLTAIKFWLPKKQRHDIAAELEANLSAEIDDRAEELGRTLADDEIAAILKEHGSPLLVASRYQPEGGTLTFGRQLIGPVVFPFYWSALKVALILLLVPGIIPAVILGSLAGGNILSSLSEALIRVAWLSLPLLLIVTLVFAAIDFVLRRFQIVERWGKKWEPEALPSAARQAEQVRRSSSLAGIIINLLFIIWWWRFGSIPYLVLTANGAAVHLAPVVTSLYLPVLIIAFINLAQHSINLIQPDWRWLPPVTGLLTSLLGLIFLFPLLGQSPLISINQPGGLPIGAREAGVIQTLVAQSVRWLWFGILLVGIVYLCRLLWLAWQTLPRPATRPTKNGVARV